MALALKGVVVTVHYSCHSADTNLSTIRYVHLLNPSVFIRQALY